MGVAALHRRASLGASVALHGAIAMAAVLPALHVPRPVPAGSLVAVSLVFATPTHGTVGKAPAADLEPPVAETRDQAMAEPQEPSVMEPGTDVVAPPVIEPLASPPPLPERPVLADMAPPPPPPPLTARRPAARPDSPARRLTRPVAPATADREGAGPGTASVATSGDVAAQAAAMAVANPPGPTVITAPRYRLPPAPPVYPARAVELGLTGTVLVRARVTPDGSTEETRLWRTSGHALLDAAALAAVRRWAFEPASVDGRRVEAWVEVPVHFRLN